MSDCLFCKIIEGDIPSTKVFENENVFAFEDISPMAKVHNLFIHKEHNANVMEMSAEQLAQVYHAISEWAASTSLPNDGFRVVTNIGPNAGQTVFHTHFHVVGGEKLGPFGSR